MTIRVMLTSQSSQQKIHHNVTYDAPKISLSTPGILKQREQSHQSKSFYKFADYQFQIQFSFKLISVYKW